MSEETLLSAARRMSRNFHADMAHGGIISVDTLIAMDTLDREINREHTTQKANGAFKMTPEEIAQQERWLKK